MIDIKDKLIADLHIHSRFSRACSKNITISNLVKWARIKGLSLLGTGDFTHEVWLQEVKDNLKDNGEGFYFYEDDSGKFPFIITGEISLMYTQPSKSEGGRGRRIHLNLLVPSIEIAERINSYLDTKGRRDYDGRPIFKIPGDEFVREMMKISEDIEVIPAHIWTPWFGLFGSNSGFDSLKECFKDEVKNIHAIETGISSDPEMNWRIKELIEKNISIVSFSDAHSFWPFRLGREATIFKNTASYKELLSQIRNNIFVGTIEVDPAYGKYHWDGHRNCGVSFSPEQTRKINGVCPKCGKSLTVGVEYRVEELASNPKSFTPKNAKPFFVLLPLHEIIGLCYGIKIDSKKSWVVYNELIEKFENEFNILINVSEEEMKNADVEDNLVDLILKNRVGKIKVKPGYDGVYGEALLEGKVEKQGKLI